MCNEMHTLRRHRNQIGEELPVIFPVSRKKDVINGRGFTNNERLSSELGSTSVLSSVRLPTFILYTVHLVPGTSYMYLEGTCVVQYLLVAEAG